MSLDLRRLLDLTVERQPLAPVLVTDGRPTSYADWVGDVRAFGHGLRDLGLRRGDRVALALGNTAAHATASTAVTVGGFAAVPLNTRAAPLEQARIISDAAARVVVHDDPALPGRLTADLDAVTTWVYAGPGESAGPTLSDLVTAGRRDGTAFPVTGDDLACLLYTSGTTGAPKGLPNTHRHAVARIFAWLTHFGPPVDGPLRTLGTSPLFHVTGLHCALWATLALGGAYHLPASRSAAGLLDQIAAEGLTYLLGAPTVFDRWAAAALAAGRSSPSVSLAVMGSAPRPPHLVDRLREVFPAAHLAEAYGTTEGVLLGSVDLIGRPGAFVSVGDLRARVVRPGGGPDDVVPDGEPGELIVGTDSERVVDTYWRRPDVTAERFRDGWVYTGDTFVRDPDGALRVGGRLDEMFVSGGENIQPAEVEEVLRRHPRVRDVAVVGTPEREWGEVCTAFVVRADVALDAEELDRFCRQSPYLADYKRPRRVLFVDRIPRNPSGKILRRVLRDRWLTGDPDRRE